MEEKKPLSFAGKAAWRKWLQRNHGGKDHVWLLHYKKSAGKAGLTYEAALEEALCYGWIDGKMKNLDEEKYMLRYSPRKKNSLWSKLNRERAERLIKEGRMTAAGMAKIDEAKRNGKWDSAYTMKTPTQLPADLSEALQCNQMAMDNFGKMSLSSRNTYVFWVSLAKRDETRNKRIAEVVRRAEKNIKPGF